MQSILPIGTMLKQNDAVKERLAMMTPQNARIWYISPKEPHNKTAYFVDAPYQVDKISAQTFADWQKKATDIALSLPGKQPLYS